MESTVHVSASEHVSVRASRTTTIRTEPPPPYQPEPAQDTVTTRPVSNVTVITRPASNVTVQTRPVNPVFGFFVGGRSTVDTGSSQQQSVGSRNDCKADTTYIRSLEGIMKLVSIPVVVIGLILTAIGFISYGGWFIFVGVGFFFYIAVVLVVETFIPNVYVHRLIDAVVMGISGFLWGITALANLGIAVTFGSTWVGIGMIFAVACCGLCIAGAIFAIMTYRRNGGNGWAPSHPIIKIRERRATNSTGTEQVKNSEAQSDTESV